ncbi:hypothetical protein CU097_010347 [Rhizopus azygosporus]|uniref:Uncharacterized protein n=1 Tax=Rhizopus azygosporus TaxID=86630 RepID=A0A367JMQ4_RHIAZ|nr:hypothetical protein CU097_010347 [Rhizopus azygosporus]
MFIKRDLTKARALSQSAEQQVKEETERVIRDLLQQQALLDELDKSSQLEALVFNY